MVLLDSVRGLKIISHKIVASHLERSTDTLDKSHNSGIQLFFIEKIPCYPKQKLSESVLKALSQLMDNVFFFLKTIPWFFYYSTKMCEKISPY